MSVAILLSGNGMRHGGVDPRRIHLCLTCGDLPAPDR